MRGTGNSRVGGELVLRGLLCLWPVEGEAALPPCLYVDLLAANEGGVVGDRCQVAANDEGVGHVDAGSDQHDQGQREQQAADRNRTPLPSQTTEERHGLGPCAKKLRYWSTGA